MTQKRSRRCRRIKSIPFSKMVIAYVLFLASAFLIWACYEMHIQMNLEPIAYIGTGVIGLIAAALGFYVWRAKASDAYDLVLKKVEKEQNDGVVIDFNANDIHVDNM